MHFYTLLMIMEIFYNKENILKTIDNLNVKFGCNKIYFGINGNFLYKMQ